MSAPRGSIELCLVLDGAGTLVAGWLFEPVPGGTAVLSGAPGFAEDLTAKMERVFRQDVLDAFAGSFPPEVLASNGHSGFVAFSPGATPDNAGRLVLTLSASDVAPVLLEATPRRFEGELDEGASAYLRYCQDAVLTVLRRHGVQAVPSASALVAGLGGSIAPEEVIRPSTIPREPAHFAFEASADGVAAAVDHAYFVPDGGVFVVGWLIDAGDRIRAVRTEWSGGAAQNSLVDMIRVSRPDVDREYGSWQRERTSDRFGFAFFAELPGASHSELESSLSLTLMTDAGAYRRLRPSRVQAPPPNPLPIIREMLTLAPPGDGHALFTHLGPAVESLWSHRTVVRERPAPVTVGELCEQPTVSVVVPVYGRYDLIEYQLARLSDDADFRSHPGGAQRPLAELVLVVDDPRIAGEVEHLCRDVYPLFHVPCRIVPCTRNHGFAGATNIGAGVARGRLLLLLNSDVMPRETGWLSRLKAIHDGLPARGALAPKLLFPDGSIQHVGIEFERLSSYPGLWLHTRPSKGYPNHTERFDGAHAVPAVTTACMMVDKDLYDEVGGLDEGYIIGDVEDTDFCLKLRVRGHGSYYAPGIELHHLELQSQTHEGSIEWRASLNLFNAWRQTRRWGKEIETLMRSAG